jgi:SAM-dependent methyltransferase
MSTYLFDHALEREHDRLRKLEQWLDPGTLDHLRTIGVAEGWRCLELAAGAGSIARRLGEMVGPSGSVLATDLDLTFLQDLDMPNVEVRRHDLLNDDLPEDAFDLAHTRLLLMHLPERERALDRIVAAVKPGGWIFIEDMDMYTWIDVTESAAMDRVRDAMKQLLALAGADAHFGRRLSLMMWERGLEGGHVVGRIVAGARENNPGLQQFKISLLQLKDMMVASGLASAEDVEEAVRLIDDESWHGLPPAIIAAWARKPLR